MMTSNLSRSVQSILIVTLLGLAGVATADQTGDQWVILIGCENYKTATPLMYTVNDVDQITATMHHRGGTAAKRIVKFVDDATEEQRIPTRENLMRELPKWFAKPRKGDRVMVYFSGHGFRSKEGKLYLAPLDCDPSNPTDTGVPVAWLREQIAGCKADFKLLILDACHAGTEKGADDVRSIVGEQLAEPFRGLERVATLASSTADQKSQIWPEKRQSLFTFWLNRALKGHADENGDGIVDIDELNKYVHDNVTQTSKTRFPRPQTPVRIIPGGLPGSPTVIDLVPLRLKHLISSMADEIAWSMESRGLKKVGVLQFTSDTPLGEAFGGKFGALGRWCSAELESQLLKAGTFDVVDSRELINALKKHKFTIDQLGSKKALAKLSEDLGGMPALVTGTLRHRVNRTITLQSKLKNIDTNSLAGAAGGSALLNASEWAMLGGSVAIRPEDRPAPVPGGNPEKELIERLDEKARGPHPMRDSRFPYRVSIYVGKRERKGEFQGNDYVVPLRKGEKFWIRIRLLEREMVCMRLLVDGLNTLPQRAVTKGISTIEIAPVANLSDADAWILDPTKKERNSRGYPYGVRGFFSKTGSEGEYHEFIVTDDDLSLAARKNFTENLGLITAAFYMPSRSRAGITIDPEGKQVKVNTRKVYPGELISVINIRYVDPDELPRR